MKTIAVDLDDTLNNFSKTLENTSFLYDASYNIPEKTFDDYIKRLRENIPDSSDLLSTEYRYFSSKIHHICYDLSAARTDGVEFMNWLRDNHWRIVICTHRDLRRVSISTRTWLLNNRIPYDYLFMASNKLEFCWIWGIEFLVDDNLFYASSGSRYGVSVFYPIMPKHDVLPNNGARGFSKFEEVKQWI